MTDQNSVGVWPNVSIWMRVESRSMPIKQTINITTITNNDNYIQDDINRGL